MRKIHIDLELLVQSFTFDDEGLGKEYLDTNNGDIINIPDDIEKVVLGELSEDNLTDWKKDLLEDAYIIGADMENRYVLIPKLETTFSNEDIKYFILKNISDSNLSATLFKTLEDDNPIKSFKYALSNYPQILDAWYDYEDSKRIEQANEWLKTLDLKAI
jgi:hypothetical protein